MRVLAKLPNGRTLTLEIEGEDTVEALRNKVAAQYPEAHPDLQTIGLGGRVLEGGRTMKDYDVQIDTTFVVGIRPPEQEVALNVGGKPFLTVLSTLLARPGSGIHSMFEGMTQGGAPSFPTSRTGQACGAGGTLEGVPHTRLAPSGPLPRRQDGAYLIDRNGKLFDYVLDYLRNGETTVLPSSAAELNQLAQEARYYGLDGLVHMCVSPLRAMAAASGVGSVGHAVAEIVTMSDAERASLCEKQGIGMLARKRISAEVTLRRTNFGAALSDESVYTLMAAGHTADSVRKLDAAAAAQLGLCDDDIRVIAEGEAGWELRHSLAELSTGAKLLSEPGVRVLAAARLPLADVRRLDGAAALELGLCADDVQKLLWISEAGTTLRQGLEELNLSDAGMGRLVAQGVTLDDATNLTADAARDFGLSEEDAVIVGGYHSRPLRQVVELNRLGDTILTELEQRGCNTLDDVKALAQQTSETNALSVPPGVRKCYTCGTAATRGQLTRPGHHENGEFTRIDAFACQGVIGKCAKHWN